MLNAPLDLRRTAGIVGAVPGGFALVAHQWRATFGAATDELDGLGYDGALVQVHAHDLRDDLATFLYIDMVANVQVEGADEVLVVQRGATHRGTGQLHRLHVGHGGHSARPPHLVGHFQQASARSLGLELIGNGPTGALGRESERALLSQTVHFQHDAVGSHRQVLALRVPVGYEVENFLNRLHLAHAFADLEAPLPRGLEVLEVALGRQLLAQEIVQVGIQPASGHHAAVLTLQRAAGSIAWIGEERLLGSFALLVQTFEDLPGHKNLAPYLKLARIAFAGQHKGNGADGSHVLCHIVAMNTVATGHGLHQTAIHVGERDGKSVVLHFAAHLEGLSPQSAAHAVVPLAHVLLAVGVGQRQHGIFVGHLLELTAQVASHALRGRVRVGHFGVQGFQILQFVHQQVELLVADDGLVQHVVAIVVLVQFAAQLRYALLFLRCAHREMLLYYFMQR